MASDSLSQNEIDALLGGPDSARVTPETVAAAAAAAPASADTQVYDFRRPHRISKEKLRALEAMYERFSKALEGWLLTRVRGGVRLRMQSVEYSTFNDFTLSLPTPCAAYTFEVRETGGQHGVIDFGHEFAYFLVDRLFGGGTVPAVPSRSMTPIERMAVRGVAERVLAVLAEVWQDHIALELGLVGFESIPEILHVANREDPMLVANFEVTAAESTSILLICLPLSVLEKFFVGGQERRASKLGSPAERDENRVLTELSLRGSRVSVAARLPTFQVPMRELLGLAVGSVLPTGIQRTAPLDVFIGSQRRYFASPGRAGPALAVRITDGLQPAPETDTISIHRQ